MMTFGGTPGLRVAEVNRQLERKRVLDRMAYCNRCMMVHWKDEACACAIANKITGEPRVASVIVHPEVGRARAKEVIEGGHLGAVTD
jgi:hypothetical protein